MLDVTVATKTRMSEFLTTKAKDVSDVSHHHAGTGTHRRNVRGGAVPTRSWTAPATPEDDGAARAEQLEDR